MTSTARSGLPAIRGGAGLPSAHPTGRTSIVPEPASLVLVVTGLAGLFLRRRMHRQNQADA